MKRLVLVLLLVGCSTTSIDSEFQAKIDACNGIEDENLRVLCLERIEYTDGDADG